MSFSALQGQESFGSSWSIVKIQHDIHTKTKLSAELHLRSTDQFNQWQQIIFRPYITFQLHDRWHFMQGYSYFSNYPFNHDLHDLKLIEHQLFQRIFHTSRIQQVKIRQDIRLEQRLRDVIQDDGLGFVKDGHTFQLRTRYRLSMAVPILKIYERPIHLKSYGEIAAIFDKRNSSRWSHLRGYLGADCRIHHRLKFGLGYLINHIFKKNATLDNHIFLTSFNVDI